MGLVHEQHARVHSHCMPQSQPRPAVLVKYDDISFPARDFAEFQSEFAISHVLDDGAYGSVLRAIHKPTGNVVAVKTVKMRRENAAATKREVELSMLLRHPSIIRTLAVYAHAYVAAVMRAWNPSSALGSAGCVVKKESSVLIVQDYAAGGDLFDFVAHNGPVRDEGLLKWIFMQLVSALLHMHENVGAVHRDVKPENVLLQPQTSAGAELPGIRLIDFGLSQYSSTQRREPVRGLAGTQGYMSPEVASLPRSGKGCVDGRAADVWSLAITMFTVVMAALPWNSASPADPFFGEYLMRRRYGELGAVFGHDMSAKRLFTTEFCILFDRMLDPNPRDRLTLREASEFAHVPWFKSGMEHPAMAPGFSILRTPTSPCPCRTLSYGAFPCGYCISKQYSPHTQGVYMQSLPPAAPDSQTASEQLSASLRINGDNIDNSSLLRWHARRRYTSQELAQVLPSEDEPEPIAHHTPPGTHSHAAHKEAQAPLWAGDVEVPGGCRIVAAGA